MQSLGSRRPGSSGRRLQVGAGLLRPPGGRIGRPGTVLATLDRFTRGPIALVIGVGVFFLAGALPPRIGVAVAGGYILFCSAYCFLNFWVCREAHCVLTGPGFGGVGLVGVVAAVWPGGGLSWYRVNAEVLAFLVVLAVGFAFERVFAARSGQRTIC